MLFRLRQIHYRLFISVVCLRVIQVSLESRNVSKAISQLLGEPVLSTNTAKAHTSLPVISSPRKPLKPLRPECLAIIQRAQLTDTSFIDVAGNHSMHPHMGAMDEQGNNGYIHNVTALRNNPPPSNISNNDIATYCSNRDDDYKMLKERVFVDMEYEQKMQASYKPRLKILCTIYTSAKSHHRLHNIRATWGYVNILGVSALCEQPAADLLSPH
jgi:hypothetical protein